MRYGTWSMFSAWPFGWRLRAHDVPVALSPEGVTNLPVGAAARPMPMPLSVQAWRWEDLTQIENRRGWIWFNGHRFTPATGHVSAKFLRELAATPPSERDQRIQQHMTR
ncbi:MAG: hypothetical protein J6386_08370 [Candidatus Synoicihabitans palmerolidicus]|nr:hypothetical protein [Candidatus Synoicihabitans palmerolidicus]